MDTKLRPSGIEGLGDMPWGTHFCLFYETKEDLLDVLIPYFKKGLENHESCLWVTPEPLTLEEAKRTMREAGPEFERLLADGQIEIVSYADWYLAEGRFDIQRVLQDWIDKHDLAIAKGYAGLRCTGNTFWLEKHQWDSFAKYEAEIDEIVSKLQIIVLCTYPLESRSARDVIDVVHQHQFTVAKRSGVWEHLEGSELKQARDKIRQLNAVLERRVVERTAQLAAANEQLKSEITERKHAEEETKHQAARAETLVRIAARLNKQLDLDAVIHAVCEEAINTFKVSQATMSLYDKKSDLLIYAGGVNIPPEYAAIMEPITRSQFDDFLRAMGPIIVLPDIQSLPDVPNAKFSSDLDVRTVVTAAMLRDQELVGVLVVGVNGHVREFDKDELTLLKAISDQAAQAIANAQLLKAANEQHEQLRALSAKLVEAQESERKRLAREIHDDISQTLTASIMQLGTAKSLMPKSAKSAYTILEQTEELIKNTLEQTRLIIADLRPPVLDDLGLAPALRRLGDELQESASATVKIKTSRLPKRLTAPIEVALFRIVQEALANIRRHAQADHVTISLAKESERVILSVQDDGIGFEKQTSQSRQRGDMVIEEGLVIRGGHFGLIGIQERVTQLGGKLKVTSAPGQGTTLRVELPL